MHLYKYKNSLNFDPVLNGPTTTLCKKEVYIRPMQMDIREIFNYMPVHWGHNICLLKPSFKL